MAQQLFVDGMQVVDKFDVPMPMPARDGKVSYYSGYEGVVLADGRKLVRCLHPGCTWTCPGDQSPGGHGGAHKIGASQALRSYTVGEMVDALGELGGMRRRIEVLEQRLAQADDRRIGQLNKLKEHHRQKEANLREQHREEVNQMRDLEKESSANWRKRAKKAEGLLSALRGYAPDKG